MSDNMSDLKVLSGGEYESSLVEIADHTIVGALYNTISDIVSPLINIGEVPPIRVYSVPGRGQFTDLVVSGDMPLDRKVDIVDSKNNKKYCGVGVREQLSDGTWLCYVDYVENNYVQVVVHK